MPNSAPEISGVDDGLEEQLTGPERRCIVTGEIRPKAQLLRFVISPDGEVVVDLGLRLPGRGIWLSARQDVVNTAVAKRLFSKAARRAVTVAPDLSGRLDALMTDRCLNLLGLARRSGQTIAGYEKVRAELQAGRVAVVIEARDAGADGIRKVRALALGLATSGARKPHFVRCFDTAQLGAVFGRDAVVHATIAPGKLAKNFQAEADKLAEFRGLAKEDGTVSEEDG